MDSSTVRHKFLEFFKSKGHEVVPSAPMVIKDDPSLMFTNAGMNQFKDYFLGSKKVPFKRVADSQKCLRVSGKHNDLAEVGHDTYHHTMFEMLGNWSFGDYFKKEAIAYAWELLTVVYKLPEDRLYASVFGGDEDDGLEKDEEALGYWREIIDEDRIIYGSKKDNFWEMGDTGPCGPCSEIHIDLRPEKERSKIPGKSLVNQDHPLVVEIWNLVFMEFNRMKNGDLVKLPAQHIDTGMGFERLCMAIQSKESNYDTDVFTPIIDVICEKANIEYGKDEKQDIAVRVIADHLRAVSFAISDGQLPSNTGAGYVIRRILRRAVRYGFNFLHVSKPFINELVPVLANQFKDVFPELKQQEDFVKKVVEEEENSFLHTLENGLKRIDHIIKEEGKKQSGTISGQVAFELYDTFGFPFDLTQLIGRERGFDVDEAAFHREMQKQKDRSRRDAEKETGDWIILEDSNPEFVGYDRTSTSSRVVRYRKIKQKDKELYQVVLDKTPFYAESGGQVGDTGVLEFDQKKFKVLDTQKENDLIVHLMAEIPSNLEGVVHANVNRNRRELTMNNHSATHLMHAALREVLGGHVEQRGSLVNDKLLRFDFSHFSKMTAEEISKVESIVNKKIRENIKLDEKRNVPIDDAKQLGAMALFGEKYGEFVRVITFDSNYSVELCGGTHVQSTGNIGIFKITGESSIASGIRRIEAITAVEAENQLNERWTSMEQLSLLLKSKSPVQAVEQLLDSRSQLEKELIRMRDKASTGLKDELKKEIVKKDEINYLIKRITLSDSDSLKKLSFEIKKSVSPLIMVLAADINGKPLISVVLSESIVEGGQDAGKLVRDLAKEIKGGGGGQPFYATAGGSDLSGLDRVVEKSLKLFNLR